MTYEQALKDYAIGVLERIVSGDRGYNDSDMKDCMDVLFG
jgi:hypothetical protein